MSKIKTVKELKGQTLDATIDLLAVDGNAFTLEDGGVLVLEKGVSEDVTDSLKDLHYFVTACGDIETYFTEYRCIECAGSRGVMLPVQDPDHDREQEYVLFPSDDGIVLGKETLCVYTEIRTLPFLEALRWACGETLEIEYKEPQLVNSVGHLIRLLETYDPQREINVAVSGLTDEPIRGNALHLCAYDEERSGEDFGGVGFRDRRISEIFSRSVVIETRQRLTC